MVKTISFIILMAAVGCSSDREKVSSLQTIQPPMPLVEEIDKGYTIESFGESAEPTVLTEQGYSLMWDYERPLPDPYIKFIVRRSEDLVVWEHLAIVDAPPFPLAMNLPHEFFRVQASNQVSQLISQ